MQDLTRETINKIQELVESREVNNNVENYEGIEWDDA